MKSILEGIRCTPSRRSLKFVPGPHTRHFLAFDPSISKEDRFTLFMKLFIFYKQLIDPCVVTNYTSADYLPEELVEVRAVSDLRHPAYGQTGLYAKRTIPSNTIVSPYAGLIEVFGTSCNSRTYTMGFGSVSDDYALDAEFMGNYGRFANDPRGVEGLSANLSAETRYNARGEPFTALVARRQIAEGEEILMAYGKAHSLSPTPWMNVCGEPLLQYRYGGIVPFPSLGSPPLSAVQHPEADEGEGHCNLLSPSSGASTGTLAAYHITWECTQCGTWNFCTSPSMTRLDYCSYCCSPKLSGAKLVVVLSSPPLTSMALATEGEGVAPTSPDAAGLSDEEAVRSSASPTSSRQPSLPCMSSALRVPLAASRKRSRHQEEKMSAVAPPSAGSALACPQVSSPPSSSSPASFTLGHHPLHTSGYSSVHVDWPMNIPFLPWQVWDNAVPMSALGKNARFAPHEHVFLYGVNNQAEADDKCNSGWEDKSSPGEGRDARKKACYAHDDRHPSSRKTRHSHKERNSTGSDAHNTLEWVQRRNSSSCCDCVGMGPTSATPTADGCSLLLSPPPPILSHHLPCAQAPVECFVLLHTCPTSADMASGLARHPLHSPMEATRQLLLNMTCRQFSGKAYRPGEVVGFMGGCIRHISDTRCRPDNSPLAIPMKYLLPRSWRRAHAQTTPPKSFLTSAQGNTTTSAAGEVVAEETSDTAAEALYETAHDFLQRLSSLSLIVTNDMMYCPCLALADCADSDKRNDAHSGGMERRALQDQCAGASMPQFEVEAQALLAACNTALVLTMDALGSPFVGLVAIRPISPFEPLLARTQ